MGTSFIGKYVIYLQIDKIFSVHTRQVTNLISAFKVINNIIEKWIPNSSSKVGKKTKKSDINFYQA